MLAKLLQLILTKAFLKRLVIVLLDYLVDWSENKIDDELWPDVREAIKEL